MMTMVISGSDGVTFPDSTNQFSGGAFSFKNRIINGDMRIDQRNAGAAVSSDDSFPVDRIKVRTNISGATFTVQQSTTVPAGFVNSVVYTAGNGTSAGSTDIASLVQNIEGTNVSDLGFGSANAKTVTLSFWVRSSVTGTFVATLRNSGGTRNYPATYTVSSANTWEYKTITVAGDTSGTWLTTTGVGLTVWFDLGSGSNYNGTANTWTGSTVVRVSGSANVVGVSGATFYITGVQLEVGSVATPFERRPYGTELALCQRYYYRLSPGAVLKIFGPAYSFSTTGAQAIIPYPVTMRIAPTALEQNGTANNYEVASGSAVVTCSAVPTHGTSTTNYTAVVNSTVASGLTDGRGGALRADGTNGATAYLGWSAEL